MRRSRVKKKTSGLARWRGNCANWTCKLRYVPAEKFLRTAVEGYLESKTGATAVILDLERFQAQARPRWHNLESLLAVLESRPDRRLNAGEAEQLQELYVLSCRRSESSHPRMRWHTSCDNISNGSWHGLTPNCIMLRRRALEVWQPRRWLRIFTAFPETFRRHVALFCARCSDHECWAALWADSRCDMIPHL